MNWLSGRHVVDTRQEGAHWKSVVTFRRNDPLAGGRSRGLRTQSRASSGRSPLHARCTDGDAPTAVRPGVRTHSLPSVAGRPGYLWPTTRRVSRSAWPTVHRIGPQATPTAHDPVRTCGCGPRSGRVDGRVSVLCPGMLCCPEMSRLGVSTCAVASRSQSWSLGRKCDQVATFRRYSTFSTRGA